MTREALPEADLIRFVRAPDGRILPDLAAKLPGRGVWVRADRASVEQAAKRGAFARSLKVAVSVSPSLAGEVEALLARRCLDLLGLGRKAGALVSGFQAVEDAIRRREIYGLIEASDGGADGRERLYRLYRGLRGESPWRVGCFSAAELGVALGRPHVVHACWLQERMARRWAAELRRLGGFRAMTPASWPPDPTPMSGARRSDQ